MWVTSCGRGGVSAGVRQMTPPDTTKDLVIFYFLNDGAFGRDAVRAGGVSGADRPRRKSGDEGMLENERRS